MIGKTLAHYEIVEKIGAGSMGEVYRARDTRLDRDVALKILPPSLAGDPERLARFERGARTAHAAVGAADEALHWLDRAVERGMINYPFLSEHDRNLDGVRSDPRFEAILGRARREWERLEV